MVPNKRYIGVDVINGEHRVMFEERGFQTALADLSTGEKQIVFRGAFLLRQHDNLAGAVVLVDEPELSLHPRWQQRILAFYDSIVQERPGKNSQIILATHSPFVVHGSVTAKHIVLRRDEATGHAKPDTRPEYPDVSSADVAVTAFDLHSIIQASRGKRLAILTEGPTDRAILETAWQKLYPGQQNPHTISSADGAKNIPRLLSPGGGRSGPLLEALSETGIKLLGLCDFDQEGLAQWNGTISNADTDNITLSGMTCHPRRRRGTPVWSALLPVPSYRQGYASMALGADSRLTIELMFRDEYVENFLQRVPVAGDGSASRLVAGTEAQKNAVVLAASSFPPEAFESFQPIFTLFADVLQRS